MHCCWEGVAAMFGDIWFDSKNHNEDWYIGSPDSLSQIEDEWKNMKIPHSMRNTPPISQRSQWKGIGINVYQLNHVEAIDWKHWTIYFSDHILKGQSIEHINIHVDTSRITSKEILQSLESFSIFNVTTQPVQNQSKFT
jgi:hypothetical protein